MPESKKLPHLSWILFGITFAGLLAVIVIFFLKQSDMKRQLNALEAKNMEKVAQSQQSSPPTETEIAALTKEVGDLILLPEGEIPTVATVSDLTPLKGQEFFARAAVGDKVLVYKNAKFAILYRPSAKKVLTASAVAIGAVPTAGTAKDTPTPTPLSKELSPSFFLLNGTTTVGLTKQMETELMSAYPKAIVVDRDNAKDRTHKTSLLVSMNDAMKNEGKAIAEKLNLTYSELPDTEATSGGTYDFLIIVGADKK